jgi:hypothetical protein
LWIFGGFLIIFRQTPCFLLVQSRFFAGQPPICVANKPPVCQTPVEITRFASRISDPTRDDDPEENHPVL